MTDVPASRGQQPLGKALHVLSDAYRRELLLALLAANPQDDDDRDPLNLLDSDTEPGVLQAELFHKHLPMLEAEGFIEWDRDSGTISKGPDWAAIEPLLALIDTHRDELPDGWL